MDDGARRLLILGPRLLAEVVRDRLAEQPGLSPITVHGRGASLIDRLCELPAELLLIDGGSEPEGVIETVRELCDRRPQLDVVVLGLRDEEEVVRFVEAGARGYLLRTAAWDVLVETVHSVRTGRTPCAPAVAARVLERLVHLAAKSDTSRHPPVPLSPRELEVLDLIADGLSNKEVAGRLGLALSTVKNHVHNLLAKLGVGRRRDAVRLAYEQGLIDRYLPWRTSVRGGGPGRGA